MASQTKTFRFSRRRDKRLEDLPKIRPFIAAFKEVFTGLIQGKKASDLEERTARAFKRFRIGFTFQIPLRTPFTLPGRKKQLDFLIKGNQPVEPDGFIGHYATIGQRANDRVRDLQLNELFRTFGWNPIHHIHYRYLISQATTDAYVRRNFG